MVVRCIFPVYIIIIIPILIAEKLSYALEAFYHSGVNNWSSLVKLLQDLITGIQNNAFSQKSVIQSVRIYNNLVFCTFCHHCPLPLLCCGSVGPLSVPPFYNVLQSVLLSITTTFEVHGKKLINFRQRSILLPFWFRLWLLYG